jgi:hypothetical protein
MPPSVRVTDIRRLAGQYSGSPKEDGELSRSAVLIVQTDGKFELRASDPRGFRTGGEMILEPDGPLTYTYDEMRGQGRVAQGRGTVHEGDGQRVIVLTKNDGTMTTRVGEEPAVTSPRRPPTRSSADTISRSPCPPTCNR